jgi:ribosome-binding factor A
MQRDLSELIRTEVKDPRVGMATINAVKVARDLGYADVYVTLLTVQEVNEQSPEVRESIKALNHAAGFLRSELGRRIKLRTMPQLRFHYDVSVGRGRELDALINRARSKDRALHADEVDTDAADDPDQSGG